MSMKLTVNNEVREFEEEKLHVAALVEKLVAKNASAAVAVGGKLVKKELWAVTRLSDGDSVTLITAAYGG